MIRSLLVMAVAAGAAGASACSSDDDNGTDVGSLDAGRDATRDAGADAKSDVSDASRDVSVDGPSSADTEASVDSADSRMAEAGEAGTDAGRDGGLEADAPADVAAREGGDASDGGIPYEGVDAANDASPEVGSTDVNRPLRVEASPALQGSLRVPPGFSVRPFASGLTNPRMMAVAPDGSVYVTVLATNQVLRLFDTNGNGTIEPASEQTVVASQATTPTLMGVHGIAIQENRIYLATIRNVFVGTLTGTGAITGLRVLVADLPDGGQHPNRTLAVGPDNNLYITVGSSCNACQDPNPESATFLRVNLEGMAANNPPNPSHPAIAHNPTATIPARVYVSGLRNTLGFDWHPTSGGLWGFDQGSDGLGEQIPPEELNLIVGGHSYGWPYCWGNRQVDPSVDNPSQVLMSAAYCANTDPPTLGYQAHSSPIGFLFYRATQFPQEYRNDAFIAFRGSWNRAVAVGYKVVRVHFGANGLPTALPGGTSITEDFLTGFLIDNDHQFGRPTGLAVDASGALLVADDTNGIIYRVSYGNADAGTSSADANTDAGTDAARDARAE